MITIQHATTRYTVTEANAAKVRAILDSGKLPKIKSPSSTPIKRSYPEFFPGMTTASYLEAYANLNDRVYLHRIQFTHADRAAPMLDAQWPEVVETPDPDYIAPPVATKARKATPAQVKARAMALLDALDEHYQVRPLEVVQAMDDLREVLA